MMMYNLSQVRGNLEFSNRVGMLKTLHGLRTCLASFSTNCKELRMTLLTERQKFQPVTQQNFSELKRWKLPLVAQLWLSILPWEAVKLKPLQDTPLVGKCLFVLHSASSSV